MHQKLNVVYTENSTSMIYKSFILELFILILALHYYRGDKQENTDFFQINCFKKRKNMAVARIWRLTQGINKLLKKTMTSSYNTE